MRPKVLISVVALAAVALAVLFLLPGGSSSGGSESPSADMIAQSTSDSSAGSKVQSLKSSKVQAPAGDQTQPIRQPQNETQPEGASEGLVMSAQRGVGARSAEAKAGSFSVLVSGRNAAQKAQQDIDDEHQLAVEARVQELLDLGMEDDPRSLQTIVSEFSNADPEIRKAAIEAAVQFGSADAIPELESAMLWAENAEQRQQIADAIDFLKLPKLTQAVALAPAARNKATK